MTDEELSARMQRLEDSLARAQAQQTTDMRGLNSRLMHIETIMAGPPPVTARLQKHDVHAALTDQISKEVERRLGGIEGTLTWLLRLGVGAVLLAVMNFVLTGGLAGVSLP